MGKSAEVMRRAPMSDEQLMADLAAIEAEVARRKAARPFEPYAFWALCARHEALTRYLQRNPA